MEPTTLYPHGYGADTSPFQTSKTGSGAVVEFVVVNGEVVGFGLMGSLGPQHTARQRQEITVEGKADAWFVKV